MNTEEQNEQNLPLEGPELEETVETGGTEGETGGEHWPEDEATASSENELQLEKEKYLRLYSEFENFRRRTSKERFELLQLAGKESILAMLPVLDDFERALQAAETAGAETKALSEGFELIYKKMFQILESKGLKAMNSVGSDFDVELHEAITKIPAPSEELKGKVVDVLEKGYTLNDKVIRYAKVVVGE